MANEFKIKNGLIVGTPPSQPIQSIQDTSVSITADASSILVTGKAIYDYVNSISGVSTLAGLLDVSIVDISNYNILQYDASSSKWINLVPTEASLYFWSLDIALLRESSIGSGLVWNAGMLDVSIGVISGNYILESSIGSGLAWNAGYLDVSIIAGDPSAAEVWNQIYQLDASIQRIDASLNDFLDGDSIYLMDACLGYGLVWNAGLLDVSVAEGGGGVDRGAANGLHILGDGSIGLGGIIIEETSIGISGQKFSMISGAVDEGLIFETNGDITLANSQAGITVIGDTVTIDAPGADRLVVAKAAGTSFRSNTGNGGIKYEADYSQYYTERSLIDQGFLDSSLNIIWTKFSYVDTSLNDIWTKFSYVDTSLNDIWFQLSSIDVRGATNGLQILGDGSIGLGGSIIQSTQIDVSDYDFGILNTFSGAEYRYGLRINDSGYKGVVSLLGGPTSEHQGGIFISGDDTFGKQMWIYYGSSIDGSEMDLFINPYRFFFRTQASPEEGLILDASGLKYTKDYSSLWGDRSIPDLSWVRNNFVPSASIGSGLVWNAGYLDVSIAQDASIAELDASINALFAIVLDTSTTKIGNQSVDGSWRLIIDTSGNLSVQKRITGTWVEKGNFN